MKNENSIDSEMLYQLSKLYFLYSYQCHIIESQLKHLLWLKSFTVNKNQKNELKFGKICKNSIGKNLVLYKNFFDEDDLYKDLEKHSGKRNQYMHQFFEIVNKLGFLRGENNETYKKIITDLNKSQKLADGCTERLLSGIKRFEKENCLPEEFKQISPLDEFNDFNGNDLIEDYKKEFVFKMKKNN